MVCFPQPELDEIYPLQKLPNFALFVICWIAAISLSQLSGYLVNMNIPVGSSVEINGLLHLTHVRNYGGVFGIFQGMGWLFALVSIGLLLGVSVYLWHGRSLPRYEFVCFGLIVGGGSSNILDRLVYGSVIDFIDVQHIPYWTYVFNTADVMVHLGIWPLILFSLVIEPMRRDASSNP